MPGHEFTAVREERDWTGKIISVGRAYYRHSDGHEVTREKVWHPGAVGIIALGPGYVWLTRQPREVAGMADSLEIPAGKLDVPGEAPLQTGKRELIEEVGVTAARWELVHDFFSSGGFTDERVWLYLATDLTELPGGAQPDEGERISAERWPLDRIDEAIAQSRDAKSIIALQHVARMAHR